MNRKIGNQKNSEKPGELLCIIYNDSSGFLVNPNENMEKINMELEF